MSLSSEIGKRFKLSGYSLRLDGRGHFESLLSELSDQDEQNDWIEKVISHLGTRNLESNVITKATLMESIQQVSDPDFGCRKEVILKAISAYQVPQFHYSNDRKKFLEGIDEGRGAGEKKMKEEEKKKASSSSERICIYPEADSKSRLFINRYKCLHQRVSRHDLFTPTSFTREKVKLKKVEYLLGTTNKLSDVVVLGMLTRFKPSTYSLEDATGIVHLDLTETEYKNGLFTEGCFVLVEGWYEDRILHVIAMALPPVEPYSTTIANFGNFNFFGGTPGARNSSQLREIVDQSDSLFVILSDLWLDNPIIMDKLSQLFLGYSQMPPTAFILMGNFSSNGINLSEHFKNLGEILLQHQELIENSDFIFVPGPNDPGFANIFPRPPLPNCITHEFSKKITKATFMTNPCRIQYCNREIVIFREDIVTKMCRNSIRLPSNSGDIPSHFAKTIVTQGHLTPLPLHTSPVYWDYDNALYLYPLPDLVIIGDKFDSFSTKEDKSGCQVINPGSFSKNEYSFKTYVPKTQMIDDCQLPSDDNNM